MPRNRAANDEAAAFLFYWKVAAPMGAPLPMPEYPFDQQAGRKHLFDWAWPYKKVAVEVNGNAWAVKGGGRHGKDGDLEKLNIAVSMGWRVFQFSPAMLKREPDKCVEFVVKALELSK